MPTFKVHGEFLITVEGQILISRLTGPFNLEHAHAYFDAITPYAAEIAQRGPWGSIAEFRESALFPRESAALMRQGAVAGAQVGVIANCWVIAPEVEGHRIIDRHVREVYEGLCAFEIFEHYDDAHAWMVQQLKLSHG